MTATSAQFQIDPDTEAELLATEQRRRDLLVASDMEGFAALIADDIVHVHTTGIVNDKAQLLHHTGSFLQFYDIERGPLKIRALTPDVAVMTGPMVNLVGKRGTDERVRVESFVTQLWVKRDGRWQIASFQATRAGPAGG